MATNEIVKTFENFDFSITKKGDAIWWLGKEVAEVLGYAQPDRAIRDHVKEDEKRLVNKPPGRFNRVVSRVRLLPRIGEPGGSQIIKQEPIK